MCVSFIKTGDTLGVIKAVSKTARMMNTLRRHSQGMINLARHKEWIHGEMANLALSKV